MEKTFGVNLKEIDKQKEEEEEKEGKKQEEKVKGTVNDLNEKISDREGWPSLSSLP